MVYSCETAPVGRSLAPTTDCRQLSLASPQEMNTVGLNPWTVESQKEIFRCNTPGGPVIQEVIIWTMTLEDSNGVFSNAYQVETCQKPVATTAALPLLSCQVTAPTALVT